MGMRLKYEFEKAALEIAKALQPLGYKLGEFTYGPYNDHIAKIYYTNDEEIQKDLVRRERNLTFWSDKVKASNAAEGAQQDHQGAGEVP
jgi:hypothetical protein